MTWLIAPGARPAARVQLRFAAVLFAACAIAAVALPSAAAAVGLLVLPIAIAVLALAVLAGFEHALGAASASALLGLASLCGIVSAVTGLALFALAAALLANVMLLLLCLRRFDAMRRESLQGALSALCLFAAQSVFVLDRVGVAFLLFAGAGLRRGTCAVALRCCGREAARSGSARRRCKARVTAARPDGASGLVPAPAPRTRDGDAGRTTLARSLFHSGTDKARGGRPHGAGQCGHRGRIHHRKCWWTRHCRWAGRHPLRP